VADTVNQRNSLLEFSGSISHCRPGGILVQGSREIPAGKPLEKAWRRVTPRLAQTLALQGLRSREARGICLALFHPIHCDQRSVL